MSAFEQYLIQHGGLVQFWTSVISALVTLAAVLVAWRTAASTRSTVEEMREARLQAVRPVLYLSATARRAEVRYKRDGIFPELKFKADKADIEWPFELRNAVDAPAFDIVCEWELEESCTLPSDFKLATVQQVAAIRKDVVEYAPGKLTIKDPADDSDFLSFDRKYARSSKTIHFELLGKSAKSLALPSPLANQLAFFALYHFERRQLYKDDDRTPDIKLKVNVSCVSPNGEAVSRLFEFRISFWSVGWFYADDDSPMDRGHFPADWKRIEVAGNLSPVASPRPTIVQSAEIPLGRRVESALAQSLSALRNFFS